eukprot:Phypoly_transcript_08293.p1 GENE.Phypoly_transcript_08293~~Phypoly_transcript_08293.p1  ORF type:complete len:495 (+),score=79.24 Phypoly_transcript_08293:205-1485(+)
MNFTVVDGLPDTLVVTGDIPAMWLRDSTNQVFPYLPYATKDPNLQQMLLGVVLRQAKSIMIDVYANAFIDTYMFNITSPWGGDIRIPKMNTSLVWEGKYELDSLAAFFKLSYYYYLYTNDTTHLTNPTWRAAIYRAVSTIQVQQRDTAQDNPPAYFFQRASIEPIDTLLHGLGVPANYTGMSKSPFRPSDDSHTLPFPIAANSMTAVTLMNLVTLFEGPANNASFAQELKYLAAEIQQGIMTYGVIEHPIYGKMFGYEVDGYGNSYAMDDANVPSLLSLPYMGVCEKDYPLYQNTRQFVLSPNNPYWFTGSVASGIGGPHIGIGYIWPMAIIMQAQTSDDDNEIVQCLDWLKASSAGTGFMHESFNRNNASDYTRSWFAWANSQFGYLILTLAEERPYLIFNETDTSQFTKGGKTKKETYSIFDAK